MKTRFVAVAALLLLAARSAAAQPAPDWSKVQFTVSRVAGSVYLLNSGEGGNIAASIGEDGVAIVDDQFAPLADKIRDALRKIGITDRPVRFVINTHFHYDHTGANTPFGAGGATIIAHDNVRTRLLTRATMGNAPDGGTMRQEQPAESRDGLPVITFDHDLTLHLNGEDIRALHLPAGHTDGDAAIFFPKANVVHLGDDFVRYGFPFIDVASGGSVQGMIDAVEKALAMLPADVKIIPGHGDLSTVADAREYVKMLHETSAAVRKAMAAGKSLARMQRDKILEPWRARWAPEGAFVNADAFIETLYWSLTGKPGPLKRHD